MVDLWGRLASVRDAAHWEVHASEQDRRSVALSLIGATIDLYYAIAEINQRLETAAQSIDYAARRLAIVRTRYRSGAVPLNWKSFSRSATCTHSERVRPF